MSPLPIYSIMRGHENATREVVFDEQNRCKQVIKILLPGILSAGILSIEATILLRYGHPRTHLLAM